MTRPVIGRVVGRLTILSFSHHDSKHRRHYLCQCECGNTKTVQMSLLSSGNTRSCGCLARETKAKQRLPNDAGVINHIVLQYQRHARDRGIGWHLTREEVDALVRQPCRYCGDPAGNLKRTKNHPGFRHNGIDRRDPALPYVATNVVAACGRCNIAKGTMGEQEFFDWARRVAAMAEQWGGWALEQERIAA